MKKILGQFIFLLMLLLCWIYVPLLPTLAFPIPIGSTQGRLDSRYELYPMTTCSVTRGKMVKSSLAATTFNTSDNRSSSKINSNKNNKNNGNGKKKKTNKKQMNKNSEKVETWRIFGIEVDPDLLGKDSLLPSSSSPPPPQDLEDEKVQEHNRFIHQRYLSKPVLDSLMTRLKINHSITSSSSSDGRLSLPESIMAVRVVRRSLDARKKKILKEGPKYTYVLDIDVTHQVAQNLRLKHQPGRNENVSLDNHEVDHGKSSPSLSSEKDNGVSLSSTVAGVVACDVDDDHVIRLEKKNPTVIIVGAGPAGLFCALTLAQSQKCRPIVIERGQPVESRGKDIGTLMHRKIISKESNFAFGEGGAGTWSDGKLTTRIGRNSDNVRKVLKTFVDFGAPEKILVDGSPHLGTDNLVRLLRNMRTELRRLGGEVYFGAKMTKVNTDGEKVCGVDVEYSESLERGATQSAAKKVGTTETLYGDAVVLATGHSARDVYEELYKSGFQLEPKGFAVGFRVEHPQKVINKIQYGDTWGRNAFTGKKVTDDVNEAFFAPPDEGNVHQGLLPVSSYRLATDKAFDGNICRGAYSFCMCPGGQIVPASTQPDEVCVNGMSFSRRDSLWANAALVVTVNPDDPILEEYRKKYGVLAGIEFQREMERRAAVMGGGNFTVPVQRLTDFVNELPSTSAPPSSYRLGVKPTACHEIYPKPLTNALKDAVLNQFEKQMPGFLCEDALLHGVETRTSSPLRVSRDPETLQAIGKIGLYPSGEGAGFAGGIVSAAVDGLIVGDAVLNDLFGCDSDVNSKTPSSKRENVGFSY
eukprot:CAMPEP_0176504180 /NCGR_PEP_ID=MMETSP0200_2-20121128/15782_1 /TAXON_ID=947934 /ORGANISM="Chaetoceros sp., Strain GSL56" /LENGTH=809 /DNA_ID=CAMNT_0017903567 /DNA_START=69 /DNA_END=2498 /DNA_ORIENTATION=+